MKEKWQYYFDQVSYDHCSNERNLSNCVKKPEKVRTSTGFEPVISNPQFNIYETFHISLHIHSSRAH